MTTTSADELDLTPMPESLALTGTEQTLRRKRTTHGQYRRWEVLPRYGTARSDRWTVIGTPIPADTNPATDYEDGQFPTLTAAYQALAEAERTDDGTHL